MSTIDSFPGGKPDSQDLEDILIEQLPEDTEEQRIYKEAWFRFSQKLKEIFDWYDTGGLVGDRGPVGPQGPAGPPGESGGDLDDEDFNSQTSNRILVAFDSTEHEQVLVDENGMVLTTADVED